MVIITELGIGDMWGKGRGTGRYSFFYIQNKILVSLPFIGLQLTQYSEPNDWFLKVLYK